MHETMRSKKRKCGNAQNWTVTIQELWSKFERRSAALGGDAHCVSNAESGSRVDGCRQGCVFKQVEPLVALSDPWAASLSPDLAVSLVPVNTGSNRLD